MLLGTDAHKATQDLENLSEENVVVEAEQDEENNLLQTMLPTEMQIAILLQLVTDEDFFKDLYAFMRTSKWAHQLANDLQLWRAVATHWFAPENISQLSDGQLSGILALFAKTDYADLVRNLPSVEEVKENENEDEDEVAVQTQARDFYLPYCHALGIAASRGHVASTQVFLERLAGFPGPHYVGEALKTVARYGYLDLAQMLTQALLTKDTQGRDMQLRSACRLALQHQHWGIVSLLMEQEACSKHSELLSEVLQVAGQANQTILVNKLITHNRAQLSLLDKLSVLTQPGYQNSGVGLDVLFGNHTWLVRAPLCFGLQQLGYRAQTTEEVDVDAVEELLAGLSIEEVTESAETTEQAIPALSMHKS